MAVSLGGRMVGEDGGPIFTVALDSTSCDCCNRNSRLKVANLNSNSSTRSSKECDDADAVMIVVEDVVVGGRTFSFNFKNDDDCVVLFVEGIEETGVS